MAIHDERPVAVLRSAYWRGWSPVVLDLKLEQLSRNVKENRDPRDTSALQRAFNRFLGYAEESHPSVGAGGVLVRSVILE
jgi:hypothetical protein